MELLITLLDDAFFSAIPAIGFAMLFNVPKKALAYCGAAAAIAHSLRTLLISFGMSVELGSFLVSVLVGVLAFHWAKKKLVPEQVFTVAAIIPMIPGKFAFATMVGLVQLNIDGAVSPWLLGDVIDNGLKTLFILGALSVGLAIPQLFLERSKPVV
ncbi:threonine/serine exporter family protein [Corallincola platygyrae]